MSTSRASSKKKKEAGVPFASLAGLHPDTLRALTEVFGYADMSDSQTAYLPAALAGSSVDDSKDLLVRASTGSGKTLGFLVPTLQRISGASVRATRSAPAGIRPIRALVLSPSRELAEQTRVEAAKLATFHRGLGVQIVIGGTSMGGDRARLAKAPCDLLVATPGRLLAHIEETPGFAARLKGVRVLVLDEADRLLDMGFEPAIRRIAAALSAPEHRQTLLFTATVPRGVREVAAAFTRGAEKLEFVDTSNGSRRSGNPAAVNARIRQEAVVLPVGSLVPALHRIVAAHLAKSETSKIIVFITNAVTVQLMAALFRASGFASALEIHSRLDQNKRNAADRAFRERPSGLLFASDVAARGVDFPGVTLVIQLGIADSAENVVHRVGRTGRGGRSGEALMLLCDDEKPVLDALLAPPLSMPIALSDRASSSISAGVASGDVVPPAPELQRVFESIRTGPEGSEGGNLRKLACKAFVASLGFYNTHAKRRLRWTKPDLVRNVAARFAAIGVPGWCPVETKTLRKMNLDGDVPPRA
jgi:ATP-dependent RNA helicase MSS116